ncbi:diaminopimelate decarboxylase [Agreia sp.]|uniref:diaminopimelate decarboxylase n=1 Tax=Agreia sp. TaxID=1872416 RepID=UPI0035BC86F4
MTSVASPLAPDWLSVPVDANELSPVVWPSSAHRDKHGVLSIGGVLATDLAGQYGTPLYVVDEEHLRSRARDTLAAFSSEFERIGTRAKVYYAGKAFLSTAVARWVSDEGLGVDVCTGGELAVALAAGVDASRIGMHGNNKSIAEIERAVAAGVGTIVIDSEIEIDRVADAAARLGRVQSVRLRVNSGVHAHTHDFLATAHEDQKFGFPLARAEAAVRTIRARPSLAFLGLHCHIGSQIFGADGFAESASRLLAVHSRLLEAGPVSELNLGGGFGIAYTTADDPTPIAELAARIADIVEAECRALDIPLPVVAFEPGRSIVGGAGVTLYSVGTIKDVDVTLPGETSDATAARRYVSVDGGMSDNARPALYGADYSVRIAGRASDADAALVRIAGKHCESGDIVVYADYLPADVAPGDLLAVPATGAYCWALASNYNLVGRPPVVAVADGEATLLIRGETEHDLLARDTGVASTEPGAS